MNSAQWQTAWMEVEKRASEIISNNWLGDEPSPFKIVAASALAIVEFAPIPEFVAELPSDGDSDSKSIIPLRATSRALAANIGYSFAKAYLEGATIGRRTEERKIDTALAPTPHFLTDFLVALALTADDQQPFGKTPEKLSRVSESFNFVTLVLESLAYNAEG